MEQIPNADSLLEHAGFLKSLARSLILDDAAADDVVQEAYLAALQSRRHIRDLRAWLAGTVRNLARMGGRARARRDQRERAAARREAVPPPGDTVARLELQRLVVDTVLDLDEPYRTTIVHRYFEGLSVRAIARHEGVASKTIHTRLRRARDQLRARLDRTHRGGRRAWFLALVPLAAHASPSTLAAGTLVAAASVALIAAAGLIATLLVGSSASMPSHTTRQSGNPGGLAASEPKPSAPPAARMLTVVVVAGESDEPLPGMEVWGASPRGTSKTQRTDDRGRVRLMDGGITTVYARGSGRLVSWMHVAAGADTVRVELAKGIFLRGRVIDAANGAPVRATVDVIEAETGTTLVETQRTDEAGRFEIAAVPAGVPFFVGVRGAGFYPVEVRRRRTRADPDLEIVVGGGGVIEGVLTDVQGKPVSSFPVVVAPIFDLGLLSRAFSSSAGVGGFRHTPVAWTDQTGRFRLRGLPLPGAYVVGATTEERSVATDDIGITLEQPRQWCELSLANAPQLKVIVKTPDGKKVHSNDVTLHDPRSNWSAVTAILNEPGEGFIYCPPRTGLYEIRVDASGYLPLREPVEVVEGALKKHTVMLDPGRTLDVIVRDAAGRPVSGVFVRVKGKGAVRWTTGGDGHWRMSGLEAREYTVTVDDPQGRYAPLVRAGLRPEAVPAEAVVHRAARIAAQVGDAIPLTASVAWQDEMGKWHSKWHQLHRDAAGRVMIAPVTVRRPLRLALHQEGAVPSHFNHSGLEPGDEWQLGHVRFSSGLSLAGAVVGEDGAPVVGAELSLRTRRTATTAMARTDGEGRFFLKHLPAEPARIDVRSDEYVLRTVSLTNVGQGLPGPIRLVRGGLLVALRLRDGRPVSCGVSGRRVGGGGEHEWKARRYRDNGHVFVRLSPGRWRLAYDLDGTWHDAQEIRIEEGRTTRTTLRVR